MRSNDFADGARCGAAPDVAMRPSAVKGEPRSAGKKYWETIAEQLSSDGWSWGYSSLLDRSGRSSWNVDARRGDGKRYIVRSDDLLTAFAELQKQTRADC